MSASQITLNRATAGTLDPKAPDSLLAAGAAKLPWKLIRWLLHLIAHAMHEGQVRRAAREIARFDDHMLRDLGITRSEIENVVRYGRPNDPGPVRTIFDLEHRLND